MKTSNAKWLLIAGLVGPGLVYANNEQSKQMRDTSQHRQGQVGAAQGGSAHAGTLDETQAETLVKVHDINQHEIQMGTLAQSKARSHDVKKYGEHLVKDHQSADKKVSDFAQKHQVQLSAIEPRSGDWQQKKSQNQQKMTELQALEGAEFDRQFLSNMVLGHDEAIALVTEARAASPDTDEAKLLGDLLPTLRRHRDDASKLLTKLERSPAKARRPAGAR